MHATDFRLTSSGMRSGSIYGRSPPCKRFVGGFGKLSVAAIYPALNAAFAAGLDEIRGSMPRYLREVGTPIEPAGFVDPGPTGLPSHVETPSHSRSPAQVSSSNCCAVCFVTDEDCPGDTYRLVGQRHRRDVEGAPHEHAGDPCAWSLFPADAVSYRPRAMNQQFPQIAVAPLADPAETGLPPGRVLPGDETEPGGEVATAREVFRIANRGRQRGRDKGTDARNRHQPPAGFIALGDRHYLLVKRGDPSFGV